MRVNIAQTTPPLSPPPSPHNTTPSSLFSPPNHRLHRSLSCTLTSKSTAHNLLRRSCSASFDGHDFPHHTPFDDFNKKNNTPHNLNFSNSRRFSTSFKHSDTQVDVLEPSLLGIRPEPPDWPARDAMIRECIARRASSIELPLSLRMIKMKQKLYRENVDLQQHMKKDCDPLNCLYCSTLFIVREIQSNALKSKGLIFNEVLDDGVLNKVQSELSCSFIWLFREVFAKTPDLMLQIMVITSGFATFSLENLQSLEKDEKTIDGENKELRRILKNWGVLEKSGVPTKEMLDSMEESEVGLWNSIVDEANKLVENGGVKDQGLGFVVDNNDHVVIDDDDDMVREKKRTEFVSPVGVEIEKDDYEEYYRTDLLYQMGLFQDPNDTLLLSNYAQFLCLVSRDYERAEECFKRAIQLDSTDAEVMTQYANFLWVVKKDLWGAEEKFQQAMAAEPNNSYHASKYASFLWSTGGEDTCYPIDSARGQ